MEYDACGTQNKYQPLRRHLGQNVSGAYLLKYMPLTDEPQAGQIKIIYGGSAGGKVSVCYRVIVHNNVDTASFPTHHNQPVYDIVQEICQDIQINRLSVNK